MTFVTEFIADEPYRYVPLGQYVVRAEGVCGGRPTFKYTRIEILGTLERLAAGETVEAISQGYEGRVSSEAIQEALHFLPITGITAAIQFLHPDLAQLGHPSADRSQAPCEGFGARENIPFIAKNERKTVPRGCPVAVSAAGDVKTEWPCGITAAMQSTR